MDGAQGPGHIDLDMNALGVDFYSSPGQKWLLGPDQTGALFIKHNLIPEVQPSRSGFGFSSNFNLEGRFDAVTQSVDKFSMSTTSAPLRAGYNAAITKILELKMPNVEKRNLELTKILKEGLSSIDGINILTPLDGNECSALTTFQINGADESEAVLQLWKNDKIVIRAIQSQKGMRVSTSFFNTEDEINKLVDAIEQLSNKAKA